MAFRRLLHFLHGDLWRIRLRDEPRRRSVLIRLLRVLMLSLRGFDEDRCKLRASALTFFTLMSIVPVLAMAFGVAKGFGFADTLENKLLDLVQSQTGANAAAETAEGVQNQGQAVEAVLRQVIEFAKGMLDNTSGGLIAVIGMALLLWSVIKLLGNIEASFNDIWGIKKARPLVRKFSDYLAFMLISPALLIAAGSVTVLISTHVEALIERLTFLGPIGDLILLSLRILPFVVIWSLFAFMYVFMPNGRVHLRSAVIGGILAGTLYQAVQYLYITFQIGVGNLGAIYGSFAALPLFLVWLQLSWIIVLYGAEIAFAHQNVDTYEFEPDCLRVSGTHRKLIALGVVHLCVKRFEAAESRLTAEEIAHELETPIRLINEVLFELTEAGVLSETAQGTSEEITYQPAQDIAGLTTQSVLDALDRRGIPRLPHRESGAMEAISESLRALSEAAAASGANRPLRNL